jgi:tRNA(fMet)-specific endonuclease VapC
MNPALIDTDILSEVIKLRDPVVVQHAIDYTRQVGPLSFSAVTRYEVVRGYKHKRAAKQLARFVVFCQQARILTVTDAIWDRASDLWAYARTYGHPHKDADLLIAATALDEGLDLATGNIGDFAWVPGLVIKDWRKP